MAVLTPKESEIMLKIFKDFETNYNANSLSKSVEVSPRGAINILKKLEKEGLLISTTFGRATFYKVNLKDIYAKRVIETLLIEESRKKAKRWLFEFKDIFKDTEILIVFGSVLRNSEKAKDVDVVFVFKKNKFELMDNFVLRKNKILLKPIHKISQTVEDLKHNLKEKNPAMINAIKTGYIIHGQGKLVEVIKNVTSV